MKEHNKPLLEPVEAIIFDCDGTLSHIEGIDELASANGVGEQVAKLTAAAMGQSGLNPEIYSQRLSLVSPTAKQVAELSQLYYQQMTPDLLTVLKSFALLKKHIYIVSAGLAPAVKGFGQLLGIDDTNIFSVDIFFNEQGQYLDFDRHSPLIHGHGKRHIVEELKKRYRHLAFVGDGLNDLTVADLVTRFIGYGGAFYRKNIEEQCQFYITSTSICSLIDLCLTPNEKMSISSLISG